ncbi:MAG: hypothetical protein ACI8RZ_001974 [Myxococcota bacterium]|jgi:hypothetical protein
MLADISTIVTAISPPSPSWEGVNAFLGDASSDALIALIDVLDPVPGPEPERLRTMALEALALQPGSIAALVTRIPASWFAPRDRQHPDTAARRLASRLGATQPPASIREVLWLADRGASWRTVLLLWIQEAVIRGADLSEVPEIVSLWDSAMHPITAPPCRWPALDATTAKTSHTRPPPAPASRRHQ